jgi:3-oxoacyl-[acyl-carrier-protein] synthase-3
MDINLIGWGVEYPSCNYTNEELCEIFNLPAHKAKEYEKMLGIKERQMCIDHRQGGIQVVRDDQMATEAAKRALDMAGLEPDDLDAIISTTTCLDYVTPGVAERVQSNLKIIEGHAINLMGGCAELINGIILAKYILQQENKKNIMVTTTDVANAYYKNFTFPYELFITGDSAAAIILSKDKGGQFKIANTNFKTIGRMQSLMPIPLWGVKEPCPLIVENKEVHPFFEQMSNVDKKYRWRRKEVMASSNKIFVKNIIRISNELLADRGGQLEDAYVVLPQFNKVMMEESAKQLNMDLDKVPDIAMHHGCEGTAAPIATFAKAYEMLDGYQGYQYVIMVALGINGSYGGVIIDVK